MSLQPFTLEELRKTNQGSMHAKLEARSCAVKAGRVYLVHREYVTHDSDGNPTGMKRSQVTVRIGETNLPQQLTVLSIDTVSVFEDAPPEGIVAITLPTARACGYLSVQGLRESWVIKHPRSPLAKVIWFALGDVRDRSLFLQYGGLAGGDYTHSTSRALDDAEALTPEQLAALAATNRQKDQARNAKASQTVSAIETLVQRVERLERIRPGEEAYKPIRQNLRVIEQRLKRAERRAS